jgi:hypothetical protein
VEELGDRSWGAADDLLEGAGGVVVLAGEDRPLVRDEQLSRPRRYPGAGETLEELPLGRDPEGDGLAEFRRKQLERLRLSAGPLSRVKPATIEIPRDPRITPPGGRDQARNLRN